MAFDPGMVAGRENAEGWIFWSWLAVAWGLLYVAASYGWRYAEYYDHGWFVPPLAGWMLWRRVRRLGPASGVVSSWWWGFLGLCGLLVLVPLRVLERVDPRWALPLWVHGLFVAVATHCLVWRRWGWRASGELVVWTLLALSALALPTLIERALVTTLTHLVVVAAQGLLGLFGMVAEVAGDRLLVDGKDVTVTEGCSGIRSGLAFLMASLFFGEWLGLRWPRRVVLLGLALVTAWAVNVGRATTLAVVRFEGGDGALDRWHDSTGLAAYVVGSAILLGLAALMERGQGGGGWRVRRRMVRKVVRKTTVQQES